MKITTTTYPSGKIYRYCVDERTVLKSDVERLACTTDEIVEIDYAVAQKFPRIAKPTDDMKVVFKDCNGHTLMSKAAAEQIGAKIGRLHSRNVYYVEADEINAGEIDAAITVGSHASISRFEVGKTYVDSPSVVRSIPTTITIVERTKCFISFYFDDRELDETIYKRKVACEYGVEKLYIHETNAISGDYEFSANDVAAAAQVTETVNADNGLAISDEGLSTFDIGDDTVKFVNGEFYQVFSRKYHAAIVKTDSIAYCIFSDGDTEVHDVSGHEVSYDEFIATLEERGKAQSEVTDAGERKIVIKSKANAKGSVSVTIDGRHESLTDAAIVLQTNHTINGNVACVRLDSRRRLIYNTLERR